jgi:hypothetical protein
MNNNSLQGSLQEAIRSALGCANTFEGDLHALCDLYGVANGHQDARLIGAAQKHDSTIGTASGALNYFLLNPSVLPTFGLNFVDGTGRLDSRVTFTRASSATYRDSTGTRQTAAINVPRFDYTASGVLLGLLIEEQRTNSFLNSGAPATQSVTLTAGTYTLWMEGGGSIAVAAGTAVGTGFGTASNGTPVTFTISTGGTVTCTVTGSPSIAQLENGPFATSYIPAAGAAATRAADVAVVSSLAGWFNASSGTLLAEYAITGLGSNLTYGALTLDDGTSNNAMVVGYNDQTDAQVANIYSGGAFQGVAPTGTVVAGAVYKAALAYEANNSQQAVNGTAAATDTSCVIPTVTLARLGANRGNVSIGNLWLRRTVYYAPRLASATLQAITA